MVTLILLERTINRSEIEQLKRYFTVFSKPELKYYSKINVDGENIDVYYSVKQRLFIYKGKFSAIKKLKEYYYPIKTINIKIITDKENNITINEFLDTLKLYKKRKIILISLINHATALLYNNYSIEITEELKNLLSRIKKFDQLEERTFHLLLIPLKTISVLDKYYYIVKVGLLVKVGDYWIEWVDERHLEHICTSD